ncbi:unnamed protein product, partial [Choristocarpus tenellus]
EPQHKTVALDPTQKQNDHEGGYTSTQTQSYPTQRKAHGLGWEESLPAGKLQYRQPLGQHLPEASAVNPREEPSERDAAEEKFEQIDCTSNDGPPAS